MIRLVDHVGRLAFLTLLLVAGASFSLAPAAHGVPTIDLSPGTGNSGTTFAFRFASRLSCPGDADAGYRWQTFIVSEAVDPASLVYEYASPRKTNGFASYLRSSTDRWIRGELPVLRDGQILPPTDLSFAGAAFDGLQPGRYLLGIACTKNDAQGRGNSVRVWSVGATVEHQAGAGPNNFVITSDEFVANPDTSVPAATPATTELAAMPTESSPVTPSEALSDSTVAPVDTEVGAEPTTALGTTQRRSSNQMWWILAVAAAALLVALVVYVVRTWRNGSETQ